MQQVTPVLMIFLKLQGTPGPSAASLDAARVFSIAGQGGARRLRRVLHGDGLSFAREPMHPFVESPLLRPWTKQRSACSMREQYTRGISDLLLNGANSTLTSGRFYDWTRPQMARSGGSYGLTTVPFPRFLEKFHPQFFKRG